MAERGPSANCLVCNTALAGMLGAVARVGGVRRSAENPNLCNRCNGHIEEGRVVELAVFFADLSGYTTLTHELGPERTHELLDTYLRTATDTVVKHDGFVTQFVGDEVMAFFNAPLVRPDFAELTVNASVDLRREVNKLGDRFEHPMDVTVGIAIGHARVGRVGSKEIAHYSAIGDVVNRAARLVARVSPGGILVDGTVYAAVADAFPDAVVEEISLKGFEEPIECARLEGAPQGEDSEEGGQGVRNVRIATTLAAILSAPCVGFVALNAGALALGLGAVGAGAAGTFLDQSAIGLPLLAAATLGAVAILYTVLWGVASAPSVEDSELAGKPTRLERRRNRIGITLACVALALVVGELFAHAIMH